MDKSEKDVKSDESSIRIEEEDDNNYFFNVNYFQNQMQLRTCIMREINEFRHVFERRIEEKRGTKNCKTRKEQERSNV